MTAVPNGIPSFFVKDCMGVLSTPLKILFNLAIRSETFPEQWETAKVSKSDHKA